MEKSERCGFVLSVCGEAALNDLATALRDRALPPIFLPPGEDDGAAHTLYHQCLAGLEADLLLRSPEELERLSETLPSDLVGVPIAGALLEETVSELYLAFRPGELSPPSREDRVFRQHPDLLDRVDEDGLLDLAGLDARPSTIIHGGSALHYHPLLRRHFTSHVNDSLVQTLLTIGGDRANCLRIAVDAEHLMPAAEFRPYFERDFWFGPPLSRDALDDPRAVGVTVHGDPEQGLLHEYPRLFVDWRLDKEGRKVVQLEELSDHDSASRGSFRILRYLHAIRDIERGVFVHCDGAVRAYDTPAYARRVESMFVTGRQSATHYRKLFRVDGVITTDQWSNVVAQWFRHNHLVMEYLGSIRSDAEPR